MIDLHERPTMNRPKHKRKDNAKYRLRIDEQCVHDFVWLADEWKYNPFDSENQNLQTGQYASENLIKDFKSAD